MCLLQRDLCNVCSACLILTIRVLTCDWNRCYSRLKVKVKWSRYRPGVAQRVGRCIALLLHDRGTRRGWVFSSTPRPHFTPGKDPAPIVQEAGWAPGPVWTGGKSRSHRDSIPHRPSCSQSLYRLSSRAHVIVDYGYETCRRTNQHINNRVQ